jgi:translation initiation factor IF-2
MNSKKPAKPRTPAKPKEAPPVAAKKPAPAAVKAPKETVKKPKEAPPQRQHIVLPEGTDLKGLCDQLKIAPRALLDKLKAKGLILAAGDLIDSSMTETLSQEVGHDLEWISLEEAARREADAHPEDKVVRPPVVTIMGHVDHGKTTLLDAIRTSNLVAKESGGITQHIGAYQVKVGNRLITFIDTPGHEAFTRLRARGAKVTDIVILVIAADEGIMPQTKEAISHAQAAKVPIMVAINKIDKPEANLDRVKQQLSKEGLLTEEWGGKTVSLDISAKEKKNIKELLEMILLLADVNEIKGHPSLPAQGVILEARLDPKKGALATVLVQQGKLSQGDTFLSGTTYGKVRALFDEQGRPLRTAEMSMPVEVLGFDQVPEAGEAFQVVGRPEQAKLIVDHRLVSQKKKEPTSSAHVTLDDLFKRIEEGVVKELALVVKADVQGSVEVLKDLLPSLGTEKVKIKIIHASTGGITDSDILLASTSQAIILGYNLRAGQKTLDMAKKENVEVRTYSVIYQLIEDIKKAVSGLLEPTRREVFMGRAEIRRVYSIPKVGVIAGCYVTDGKIQRGAEARVVRNKEVVFKGRIASLKHLKDNVTEVQKNFECGIGLDRFKDIHEGDQIEAFLTETVQPK